MKPAPSFDEIFDVMAAASVGETAARVALPDEPQLEGPGNEVRPSRSIYC